MARGKFELIRDWPCQGERGTFDAFLLAEWVAQARDFVEFAFCGFVTKIIRG